MSLLHDAYKNYCDAKFLRTFSQTHFEICYHRHLTSSRLCPMNLKDSHIHMAPKKIDQPTNRRTRHTLCLHSSTCSLHLHTQAHLHQSLLHCALGPCFNGICAITGVALTTESSRYMWSKSL